MIIIDVFNEQIVKQPVEPSTFKGEGEIDQRNAKFSLLSFLRRGQRSLIHSEKDIQIYQNGERIEEIKR